jgi:hypothetical protein
MNPKQQKHPKHCWAACIEAAQEEAGYPALSQAEIVNRSRNVIAHDEGFPYNYELDKVLKAVLGFSVSTPETWDFTITNLDAIRRTGATVVVFEEPGHTYLFNRQLPSGNAELMDPWFGQFVQKDQSWFQGGKKKYIHSFKLPQPPP